jgi:polyhydroxyalkanoate synthesis regulator phasin
MDAIEKLDKIYGRKKEKIEESRKNTYENYLKENELIVQMNDIKLKIERLEAKIDDLEKRINHLQFDLCRSG